jgi:hypothetical protein
MVLPDQIADDNRQAPGRRAAQLSSELADVLSGLTVSHDQPGTSAAARREARRAYELAELDALLDEDCVDKRGRFGDLSMGEYFEECMGDDDSEDDDLW